MDTSALEEIGLTKTEAAIYLTLIDIGETSSGPIKEHTNLHNSVVYNALERLINYGLVTYVLKGKTKMFSAAPPKELVKYVEDKKEKIELLAIELEKKTIHGPEQEAQAYIGWNGVLNAFNFLLDTLPEGEEYLAYGVGVEEQFSEESEKFFQRYQKKRAIKNYQIKILLNETARKQMKQVEYYEGFGTPEMRYVEGFAPVGIVIFGNYVLQTAFGTHPIAVIIKSKEIADSQRRAFRAMWDISKK